ncbi:hypothetical protein CLOM_g20871 [Closterium sp. NIES-68]|nr:hypothetical protein CLOM_g20871 [Closterium sp. NIES-68]GJP68508.1 hypothetical protein CLOP_g25205 [Closterium sp. NIES-67]
MAYRLVRLRMAAVVHPQRARTLPACVKPPFTAQLLLPLTNLSALTFRGLSATLSLRASPAQLPARKARSLYSPDSLLSAVSAVPPDSPVARRLPPSAVRGSTRGSASNAASSAPAELSLAEVSAQLPGDLSGYMARVRECNAGQERRSEFIPFVVGGETVGYIHHSFWQHLEPFRDVFRMHNQGGSITATNTTAGGRVLTFSDGLEAAGPAQRTEAVGGVLQRLREEGVITGWRDELYPVGSSFHAPPAFLIERAAAPLFGTKAYGVHMNGYVLLPPSSDPSSKHPASPSLHLWVARRSPSKPTFPNQLDHLVAGGQPHGISCRANMIKECEEEAAIPSHLAERAVPVGAVSYEVVTEANTLKRDVLFCYDLQLPPDFNPRNTDGEVAEFSLMPIDAVACIVANTKEYKANCNLVIIDFLIRHGIISPDSKGYLELLTGLRQGSCT